MQSRADTMTMQRVIPPKTTRAFREVFPRELGGKGEGMGFPERGDPHRGQEECLPETSIPHKLHLIVVLLAYVDAALDAEVFEYPTEVPHDREVGERS